LDFTLYDNLFVNAKKVSVFRAVSEKNNREKKQTEPEIKNSRTFVEGNPPCPLVN